MISTVRPAVRRCATSFQNFWYVSQSNPAYGSSSSSSSGSASSARPRLSLARVPPESWSAGVVAYRAKPRVSYSLRRCSLHHGGQAVRVAEQLEVLVAGEPPVHQRLLRAVAQPTGIWVTLPASAASAPTRIFISVDLPEPFSPTSPTTSPGYRVRPAPCSTGSRRLVHPRRYAFSMSVAVSTAAPGRARGVGRVVAVVGGGGHDRRSPAGAAVRCSSWPAEPPGA